MRKREEELSKTNQRLVACGNLWITICRDKNDNPIRVFLNGGKNGTCKALLEGLGRITTLALQNKVKLEDVVDQLTHIQCPACERMKGKMIARGEDIRDACWSCPDALAKELSKYIKVETNEK